MVLAKSKNKVGLGNSLMNDRFGKGKSNMHRASAASAANSAGSIMRRDQSGNAYITPGRQEAEWVKFRSVTEQAPLDEFLSTAALAGTDFTAEKGNNLRILHTDGVTNPFLLTESEERDLVRKHHAQRGRLTVPRRPPWDKHTTAAQLDEREKQALLKWRRGLAQLEDTQQDLLITPFERNLEVWRQLWRVVERCDLIVQIVDARNPLLFRCEDLEKYVKEVDTNKNNLLLVNKADLMTLEQREAWVQWFEKEQIEFRFFSAELARETNERVGDNEPDNRSHGPLTKSDILTTADLEDLFLAHAPAVEGASSSAKTQIGLVGYPNVGKSSTINALLGAKKVSVSATPGKTKHFQTIHLSDAVILCDCPGLVFPNFATTKAELVVNGILPIDQLREHTAPAALVAKRIPKPALERTYGLKIPEGQSTGTQLLRAYAQARGFMTQGQGRPDESRAARLILKDYVKGRLLYCHSPPGVEEELFNPRVEVEVDRPEKMSQSKESNAIDRAFFDEAGSKGTAKAPFHLLQQQQNGKKHFKGGSKKKRKVRRPAVDDY
ncbi:P-loop containing nucleoside triphosphate hydrolase protein [Piedraia hortae CBS 480.64]|uniref:P-loop containing nucleoside triphosphate hydrolase protein n=1 Tax=Piedraia hortae CBS 480.64 TaxID=1314780 RepID=A0A6A7C4U7_9PEZI|nr:P-loop containing nucleoside triphosphate hydrolase protein [Piedraia hortae CBS 480.64]